MFKPAYAVQVPCFRSLPFDYLLSFNGIISPKTTMYIANYRTLNGTGALIAIAAISFSLIVLQGFLELDPCPLCTVDRFVIVLIGIIFMLAWLHNPARTGQKVYATLNLPLGLSGIGLTLRHIWLQRLPPDKVPECGPDLSYMFEVFPLLDAIVMLLSGSGECAEVQWSFLGLTIPEQTLILFSLLTLLMIFQLLRRD